MDRFQTFDEFWPYYVGEHQKPTTRAWHYLGTTSALLNLTAFIVTLNPVFLLAGLISGYGPAWIGHFFVEKNRPATFTYPRWSLMADFKMYFYAVTGRMRGEVERLRADGFRLRKSEAPVAVAA